jgi:diguanylate cyclase (GGDEF)-like protein
MVARPATAGARAERIAAGSPGWLWYLAAGVAMIGGYYLLQALPLPAVVAVAWYAIISASAGAALLLGVRRHRPAYRTPWLLLAAGQLVYALGDAVFYLDRTVLQIEAYPGVDDALYLISYPLMAAGLLLFVRARTPSWDVVSLADAVIVAIGAGLLLWVFLLSPQLTDESLSWAAQLVSVAYPAMDLLLLTVAVRMVLGATARAGPHRLLYGWVGLVFAADVCYGYQELSGAYDVGNFLDAMWLTAALLLGAAALHPGMARLTDRAPVPDPEASAGRLSVLALASLIAPALLYGQYLRGAPLHVPEIAACSGISFLLVVGRMGAMVRVQRRLASTDGLTGLRTRRYFDEALRADLAGPPQQRAGIGLLLIDIDHFKRINDSYGHTAGDQALREIARRLRAAVRPGDVVARYGGEEFVVVLRRADPAAVAVAELGERIRRDIGGAPVPLAGRLLAVTVSVGAATLRPGQSADDLIRVTDEALYAAKESGRDRLVLAAADPPRTPAPAGAR